MAEFGLFFADEDQKKGIWLENNRNLEYYLLRTGVGLLYCVSQIVTLTIMITVFLINVKKCSLYNIKES